MSNGRRQTSSRHYLYFNWSLDISPLSFQMSATTLPATKSPIGSFTADAFAAHLATLANAPAWWLDRKRAAYETFASLPLPTRTNESWRFSTLAGLKLDGFTTDLGFIREHL